MNSQYNNSRLRREPHFHASFFQNCPERNDLPKSLVNLIAAMLQKPPDLRPSMSVVHRKARIIFNSLTQRSRSVIELPSTDEASPPKHSNSF